MNLLGWPVWATVATTLAVGAPCGAVNGFLIGYLRIRAFLTTLVTLIIIRSIVDIILLRYAVQISAVFPDSDLWFFIGEGQLFGIPFSFLVAIVVIALWHVILTRARAGWHINAVGGSRRSAYNAGLRVKFTVFTTYVWSSLLTSLAGVFFAARLGSAGSDTGVGLEIAALTAAVLGGNSLGGGRGSVIKSVLGAVVVLILTDSMVRIGISGGISSMILGIILLAVVAIDVRWLKNRHKLLNKVYVSPAYFRLSELAGNRRRIRQSLRAERPAQGCFAHWQGEIEGPEDVIFDRNDNLYCPNRHGDIVRFLAPDYKKWEIFVHIGGHPLGMAFDADENLNVCIGGMGLYQVSPDQHGAEANRRNKPHVPFGHRRFTPEAGRRPRHCAGRTHLLFRGDHPLRHARLGNRRVGEPRQRPADLLRPAGPLDQNDLAEPAVSKRRLHGRRRSIVLFRRDLGLPHQPLLVRRPKKGHRRSDIPNLPGYPDNINRASDGSFWVALVGMRSPALDLAMRMPSLRKRMAKRVARDQWLFPEYQHGLRSQIQANRRNRGILLGPWWQEPPDGDVDARAQRLSVSRRALQRPDRTPSVARTRIQTGRPRLPTGERTNERVGRIRSIVDWFMGGRGDHSITVPVMDGALKPNNYLEQVASISSVEGADNLILAAVAPCSHQATA